MKSLKLLCEALNAWCKKNKLIFYFSIFSFILGCICTGAICYRYNRRISEDYNIQLGQYREESERLKNTIEQLQTDNIEQSNDYKQLAENERAAAERISKSIEYIESTDDSISAIKQAVRAITEANNILKKGDNSSNCNN